MTGEPFSLPEFTMADYDLYRVEDRIFWAFIIAGLIFCAIHASRRAFRQPVPTELPQEKGCSRGTKEEEIERYTLFQPIYHWSNAVAVIALTISGWGSMGGMWGKPFVQVVVRPGRYTFQYMEKYPTFTLCAFPESCKKALTVLGKKSGRNSDKISESGLTVIESKVVEAPSYKEAELILVCRKMY